YRRRATDRQQRHDALANGADRQRGARGHALRTEKGPGGAEYAPHGAPGARGVLPRAVVFRRGAAPAKPPAAAGLHAPRAGPVEGTQGTDSDRRLVGRRDYGCGTAVQRARPLAAGAGAEVSAVPGCAESLAVAVGVARRSGEE